MVAFPSCQTALNIFEARYRVLFNTLLAGEDGLDEELIQREAKHVGSKQFGMCYHNDSGMASIGTILRIDTHVHLPDGRLFVVNQGMERFRVLKVLQQKPVLMCLVEILDEEEDGPAEFESAKELRQLFKELLILNAKIKQRDPTKAPEQLDAWQPREVSYYIASLIAESPTHQQIMLEEDSTSKRMQLQRDLLAGSVSYLRARVALEGAFSAPEAVKDAGEAASPASAVQMDEG
ncbi:hypothetical protein WJX73_003219 [Symbiochloris irregularis]|uniref:Lon N-terminal domain-containing protein n=1 Tax=Symbiochloris irregularis TaxID=706552 RepID=A0AAW1PET0_9CHLO